MRLGLAVLGLVFFTIFGYMVLQLSEIKYLNWERITYFNQYSILSFKHSGSYVPMLEHNFFYRLFAFNFRPLFFDVHTVLGFFASLENLLQLAISLMALYFIIRYYKHIHFPKWIKTVLLFALIASFLFIQRYANLGIFMRTKIMFQPFVLIALFCIIRQGFTWHNSKN